LPHKTINILFTGFSIVEKGRFGTSMSI